MRRTVTPLLDIYRSANILVREHGADQAPLMAARRADALLELGDVDGQRVWKAVLLAVQELTRAHSEDGRADKLTPTDAGRVDETEMPRSKSERREGPTAR